MKFEELVFTGRQCAAERAGPEPMVRLWKGMRTRSYNIGRREATA